MADIWDGVKKVLGAGLPLLGTALGGPAGGAVGGILADVLDLEEEPTPENLEKALRGASPEQWAALREAQMKHREELARISLQKEQAALEETKAYLGDRSSARDREVELTKATGKRDTNLYVLAWTVVIGFFTLVGILMFVELPVKNVGPVNQLFGAMAAGFGMVLAYFFGSSKGSAEKTEMLAAPRQGLEAVVSTGKTVWKQLTDK